jgi:uncharacterized protein (TIGR03118 family)
LNTGRRIRSGGSRPTILMGAQLMTGFRKYLVMAAFGASALHATTWHAEAGPYVQTNLVSDIAGLATITDPNLVNPWGVSHSGTSPFWVSDQGKSVSTLYNVTSAGVTKNPLTVTIPTTAGGPQGPTGQVNNNTSAFSVNGTPASFIFANLNGTISAWNQSAGTTAVVEAPSTGGVYTGLAISSGPFLYAANGAQNRIDVFNGSFANVTSTVFAGKFVDPDLPAGLVPFNVQNIGGNIFVTYAPAGGRPNQIHVPEGVGAVAEFDANGNFVTQLIAGSKLASPWGITLAPASFGPFGGDLLVANFSFDASEINAFNPSSGVFDGTIPIDDGGNGPGGLWALIFGNGGNGGLPNTLYFSDGIAGETHGLFAAIGVPEPSSLALLAAAFGMFAARRARARR